jgi:prepilin signal peptidase PulO-like enzyme (type II secretory pathway)
MGDVKLIAGITLALAWFNPFLPAVAILVAFLTAGAGALVLLILQKTRMGSSIALGPYLLFGFAVCFIAQGWS